MRIEQYLRHDTTFEYTQESSCHEQTRKAVYKGSAERDEAESAHEERQVPLGAEFLEKKVAGYFDKHVDNVEDGCDPVEPHTRVEVQVIAQTLDTRISNVDSG